MRQSQTCLRCSSSADVEDVAGATRPRLISRPFVLATPVNKRSGLLIVDVERQGNDNGRRDSDMSSAPDQCDRSRSGVPAQQVREHYGVPKMWKDWGGTISSMREKGLSNNMSRPAQFRGQRYILELPKLILSYNYEMRSLKGR